MQTQNHDVSEATARFERREATLDKQAEKHLTKALAESQVRCGLCKLRIPLDMGYAVLKSRERICERCLDLPATKELQDLIARASAAEVF